MPQCHLCVKKKGTTVWVSRWMERLLTCDDCEPIGDRFKPDPFIGARPIDDTIWTLFEFRGRKDYPWACTGMKDPVEHSFKCFDCHEIAPSQNGPGKPGRLDHMALWMYGNVELPKEFRFTKYDGSKGEFICCEACGQKRHETNRDGKGTVTEDVARYITEHDLPIYDPPRTVMPWAMRPYGLRGQYKEGPYGPFGPSKGVSSSGGSATAMVIN